MDTGNETVSGCCKACRKMERVHDVGISTGNVKVTGCWYVYKIMGWVQEN